ncbi:hypothetical protein Trco_001967 [Trichoderma cornu-damae]|uniref:Uncharacterized protein n=1 Tax=Trichoderma cornu-damae TaxID=654480 RepID=A0A9P8QLQ6_9HYPO|nr:hypothetical protein Trco_001967 [Trichoderma cornu-damae]
MFNTRVSQLAAAMDKTAMPSRRQLPETTAIYIIVGAVAGITLTVAVVVFLVLKRRRGQKYSQLRRRKPNAADRESYRKSVMSTFSEVDDAQRQAMIRKSLATRSSTMELHMDAASIYTTTTHPLEERNAQTPLPLPPPSRDEELSVEESQVGLRADWKEWEARLHENQSLSLDFHPAVAPSRKGSTSSTGSNGAYLLDAGPPSHCHIGVAPSELDRRSLPSMTRPHSVVSVDTTRSLPANYEVTQDPRTLHPLQQSWAHCY